MAKERWLPPIRWMHEWPLVLFTALVVPGAGIYAATLLAELLGLAPVVPAYLRWGAAGLLVAGLIFSFLHLGRPGRAARALWCLGRNPMSSEIAAVTILIVLALALTVPAWYETHGVVLGRLAGACAVALLVTIGLVYFLRAHWPWRTVLVAGPLISGLAAGAVLLALASGNRALRPLTFGLLAVDALLCLAAWRRRPVPGALPTHPALHEYRRRLLLLRLVFANILPMGLLVAAFRPSAAIAVGMGVLLDRFSFYGLASVETTEASVANVERLIEAESGIRAGQRAPSHL